MIATLKVLSAVLSYPTEELQAAAHELIFALNAERVLDAPQRAGVGALIQDIADDDLLDRQAAYVDLFDRTRALSLHLFEHVHGESRHRGQAMVSLLERYRTAGVDVAGSELPDFIPLFLEFLSTLPMPDARAMLADTVHILTALGERLRKRKSGYAVAFEALAALSEREPDADELAVLRQVKVENPRDLASLDRSWEEAEVRFGPNDPAIEGCPRANDILRRIEAPGEESRT
jgi:nitrate reductase delta subunit